MVVDIGGGTTEVAVISLGGIVTSNSIRIGGDKMDLAISEYIKKKYNLAVGEQTAEEIKIKIGSAVFEKEPLDLEIKGRDLISGLPRNVKINSNEVCEAISDILSEIIQVIKSTLRETPAELSADIMEKGIVMTGGGSLLRNLPELFEKSIGIPIILAEEPMFCVAKGTGKILEGLSLYKRVLMTKK
jgi:rod shape-determining protein MreB